MLEVFDVKVVELSAYVIKEAARVNQKRANPSVNPDSPDARRLQGARRAVKNAMTVKTRARR